jgi:hypothetical protein
MQQAFNNPFRPGAGQPPPFLAGRQHEQKEFDVILRQAPILKNLIITGLRGVGKTVLLETLKPLALQNGWFWAGTDLSETVSVSEKNLAIRILADLSSIVSSFTVSETEKKTIGFFAVTEKKEIKLSFDLLMRIYESTPGLNSDKLKNVLELVWNVVKTKAKGIVLAYDEAQNLTDQAQDKEYPLSVLLEITQYMQRKEIPYLLVLTGLPTLFPNLVEARTYAERMFQLMTLEKLPPQESREAIIKPIEQAKCPVKFSNVAIEQIISYSGGYPYFIQFFCKETYDSYLQQIAVGVAKPAVALSEIVRKLDTDFYAGRWGRISDRQRDLLEVIAKLPQANEEFSVLDIVSKSKEIGGNLFTASHINQLLKLLINLGFIFKNRHGRYSFAVPMLADYINRQKQ